MVSNKGFLVSEEEYQIQQPSCFPVIPSNQIPIRPQPNLSENQEGGSTKSYQNVSFQEGNWKEIQTSNGATACPESNFLLDQSSGIDNWEAAQRNITENNYYTQTLMNASHEWNNIPFTHLLASAEAAFGGLVSSVDGSDRNNPETRDYFLGSYSQINSNLQQQHESASMLLLNQNLSASANMFNTNSSSEMPQYGFPASHLPSYHLSSLSAYNAPMSLQFEPATPQKGKRVENYLSGMVNVGLEDQRNQVQERQKEAVETTVCNITEQSSYHSPPTVDSSSVIPSTPRNECQQLDKGLEQGTELDTPAAQQKQRRKKHRPKVIREGKPKRIPKPKTPKQEEHARVKRKYVRRKGINPPNSDSLDQANDRIDGHEKAANKTCKRSLFCNSEHEARDENRRKSSDNVENSSNSWRSNLSSAIQAQDSCTVVNTSHTDSTSENIQGLDGILEKSPTRALFDLNQSSPQMRESYLSLAEKQIREDLLVEPKKRNIPSAEDACLNSAENVYSHLPQKIVEWGVGSVAPSTITTGGLYSTPMNQNDSNCRTSVLLGEADEAMGSKRVYSHMMDKRNPHSQTLLQNLISRQVYKENNGEHECQINTSNFVSFFTPINKKKRTEEGQHLVTYGELPSKRIPEDGSSQTTTSRQSIPNDNNVASQVRHGQSVTQFINHSETTAITNRRNNSEGHQYVYSMSEGGNSRAQNVYAEQVSQKKSLSGPNCDKLPSNIDITGMMTKTTPEVSNRVYDLTSLTAVMERNHLPPTPSKVEQRPRHKDINDVSGGSQSSMRALALDKYIKKRQIRKTPQLAKSTSYPLKSEVHSYERQVVLYDYHQTSARNKGPSSRRKRYLNPIDQIIQKLSCLSLNSESKTSRMRQQNALVPYGMVDTMVPYGEPFHPIKKRKPRPKVDLDPESDRVWKLLMGKECSQGVEGTDADKEKWWEEERRVFRGRADSFIARMHLVQGDRRFTRWKGSVVDSVIGVFLTQNVSDHLSSSAFMSLAARFPLQSTNSSEGTEVFVEEPEICILDSDDQEHCYEQLTAEPSCDQGSNTIQEPEHIEGKEVVVDSFGSNTGSSNLLISSKDKQSIVHTNGIDTLIEETETRCFLERENMKTTEDVVLSQNSVVSTENLVCSSILQTAERYGAMREHTRVAEVNDRSAQEDVISSQSSALSSQTSHSSVHQDAEQIGSCSDCNSEAQNMTGRESSSSDGPTSFLKLLQMAGMPHTMISQEYIDHENGNLLERDNKSTKEKSSIDRVDVQRNQYQSAYPSNVSLLLPETQNIAFSNFNLHTSPDSVVQGFEVERLGSPYQESKSPSLSVASGIKGIKCIDSFSKDNPPVSEITSSIPNHLPSCSEANMGRKYEVERTSIVPPENIPMEPANPVERGEDRMLQAGSCFQDFPREQVDVERTTALMASQKVIEKKVTKSNLHDQVGERTIKTLKAKGGPTKEKRENIDWDRLRKEAHLKGTERERTRNTMDTMDYEAIRCAEVGAIADTIKERGMNNMLAGRIKDFLNRVVRDHGSIDLEWLRDVPPDKAKEYLLSVRGLGLKSVECVRLLTLHHLAFPVDTNVGRIAVRLGWVPLQPLPESLQLHLLELYPVQESIQKYLWPRLCKLDQRTLYELHYQMITFGKVFCSKHKPNCNACPMRAECRHFASAFASARLALPGPEEKGIVTSNLPDVADTQPAVGIKSPQLSLPPPATKSNQLSFSDTSPLSRARSGTEICEPIIEEPSTPETTCIEVLQSDIEDAFYEDPDEIPVINLNIEEFTLNLTNYMQENNMQLQGDDVSKALVALNPEAASIPMPKLKNVSRLRTEHQVYELPDSHPLLEGRDRREPDDPCSYLLAIWTPGETADSIQPPERACSLQGSGHLCEDKTCFSCNSIREANSQIVRGTLLIPCRTAMRGSFPLNGTYFQVNEVFADHDSSLCPISVPRALIWNLPRRTVFFGSSVPTIFKGLSTEAIQSCFWRGFVCVRGFDQRTRAPRPLIARLHIPASRMNKNETKTDNKG